MTIEEYCTDLDSRLSASEEIDKAEVAAKAIWQVFNVKPDEVTLFKLNKEQESLQFVWPKALRTAGAVPISAHQSLVATTAREKKSSIENAFASTPHLTIFERFRQPSSEGMPIQKIMSVPLVAGEEIKGVIQVCRKGETRESAGNDFTPANLSVLSHLAAVIAARI